MRSGQLQLNSIMAMSAIGTIMLFGISNAYAEVVRDNTFKAPTVSGDILSVDNNYNITADLGSQVGGNLFHSFESFNIEASNTARFSGPTSVSNIVTRVTGGTLSTINGQIVSTIPNANFWLINPAGLLFGNGASLDVQGSFHASTADYIRLNNGATYQGDIALQQSILSSSSPAAFGFYDTESLNNTTLQVESAQLGVEPGRHISLIGSRIELEASQLTAEGGQVSVVSIGEGGEVFYSDQGFEAFRVDASGNPTEPMDFSGDLSISSTVFNVDGERKGNLQVQGGDIEIDTRNTDFVSTVSNLKATLFEDVSLLEKPCELAEFYGQGSLSFTVDTENEETEFGVEVKKARSGALGALPTPDCL